MASGIWLRSLQSLLLWITFKFHCHLLVFILWKWIVVGLSIVAGVPVIHLIGKTIYVELVPIVEIVLIIWHGIFLLTQVRISLRS